METRPRNKTTHPGLADKTMHRRTTAEVQQERAPKAQAKAAREEAKQRGIERAAAFEHADKANEDMVDTTPRPLFNSKPWPPPRNRKTSNRDPVAEISDVEMSDGALLTESSDTMDESADQPDEQTPPAKKQKARAPQKATAEAGGKSGGAKMVVKKTIVDDSDVEIVPPSDEETPKPKKKVKVRDEINIATKKIEENENRGNKYSYMVKSVSSKQAEEGSVGKQAPKAPSKVQLAEGGGKREGAIANIKGGRALKREGAIADIKALTNPDESLKRSQQNDPTHNRYFSLIYMFPLLTLNQSTLFYWTLSDSSCKKRKHSSVINDWASAIPTNAKPPSQAPKSISSHAKSDLPSLTSGASRSSAPSVLTQNVKIISHRASGSAKVKDEPAPDSHTVYYGGGLSDNDEMRGEEREVAINSPPKGKKRITSEVSLHLQLITNI
jgi:hypothetical protein